MGCPSIRQARRQRKEQESRKLYRVGIVPKTQKVMETLESKFRNMHRLDRDERIQLNRELARLRPEFLENFVPRRWWWRRCDVKVLIVCDGSLNYGTGGFHLSEFLTTFNELEARSSVDYKVTLAHRGSIINSPNPVVVDHIGGFRFDTSVNLSDFDQVWLFAISPSGSISAAEVAAIEQYMDGGGGLFATGDHGWLGNAMCGNIPRVKDMRYWRDFPNSNDNDNEVSMRGKRRNDTNAARPGNASANTFDHQSDGIPQTIAVRTFGVGSNPHPLLSISPSRRPSGIIDIMPDHPHEGECAPETSFTVNGTNVPTQVIATSFVPGGNTAPRKDPTEPHCFPSISVWDGRAANAGRIVVDSTWHHFVNINLNGTGSGQTGLSNADFEVIREYYMNIATWMTRRKIMWCLIRREIYELKVASQVVEASLNNPEESLEKIKFGDLGSIGALAEEELASKYNPSFARTFFLELLEDCDTSLADQMDGWKPVRLAKESPAEAPEADWLNLDLLLHTAIGAGFIALRDNLKINNDKAGEEVLEAVLETFRKGMEQGLKIGLQNLERHFKGFMSRG